MYLPRLPTGRHDQAVRRYSLPRKPNKPMLLTVKPSKPPRPTPPASGQRRPDLVLPEHLLPGSKSAEPLAGAGGNKTMRNAFPRSSLPTAVAVLLSCATWLTACNSELENVPSGWEHAAVITVDSYNCNRDSVGTGPSATYSATENKVQLSVHGIGFSCFPGFSAIIKSTGPTEHELLIYPTNTEMMLPNGEIPCTCSYNFELSFDLEKGDHQLLVYTWRRLDQPPGKILSIDLDL